MLYFKAFHIIAMVAWFAGLFYLPRLFVYHADTHDEISNERFKIMERRLYYGITWPAAIITTVLGLWLLSYNPSYYMKAGWMHTKLTLVLILWGYHLLCGYYRKAFVEGKNQQSSRFFRIYNEIPTLLLVGIVLLVVVK
ncbi:protoporphyrinogen oxidase HemJ [Legionella lytica]|uniref:Protoporphyrinogen IX oxidase n=1 Tax=Legionella lytica TaxID=96232 RepID=A0ABW8D474_9GAMM